MSEELQHTFSGVAKGLLGLFVTALIAAGMGPSLDRWGLRWIFGALAIGGALVLGYAAVFW